ncbi:MAG: MAE_28990/MAE_18760 family HEPN-like nuclease [Solirubrobacteraceae bacterium]
MARRLTREALLDELDADLAWRRVELAAIRTTLNRAKGPATDTAARAAVALAYAHWEGYVVSAGRLLVRYVRDLRLTYAELSDCYLALCLAGRLLQADLSARRIQRHLDLVAVLRNEGAQAAFPSPESAVQAGGNLKSEKFADIVSRLGIEAAPFELQYRWIDGELLRRRNSIAHGSNGHTDVVFADEAIERVAGLVDAFRSASQNAAVLEVFRR